MVAARSQRWALEKPDIDMVVNQEVWDRYVKEGWKQIHKGLNDEPLVRDDFEMHIDWTHSPYAPTLEHLLKTAAIIDGIPFASIEEVKKWKASSGRPKDLADLKLIADYQASH